MTDWSAAISCQTMDKVSTLVASKVAVPVQLNKSVGVVVTKFCENTDKEIKLKIAKDKNLSLFMAFDLISYRWTTSKNVNSSFRGCQAEHLLVP